ncbi:DUF4232 domain-containing protein [Streptomyces sp. NPDC056160]|uniref:DUF4232 domain-containing protein n=1 Tax=Streptomyces sp. NPDC056160 TaxID=3345731 RepID=UPI0035D55BAC
MRTNRKFAVTAAAVALAGATGVGVAQASPAPAGADAPSACRPANHLAKITEGPASSGHSHYRVTLTAPRGYAPCELAGSPTDVRFSNSGKEIGVTAGRYGSQKGVVTFGPGHPVHFDIQVRDDHRGTPADEVSFTLRAPGGEIPGASFADGSLTVTAGALVGPVQRGA